MLGSEIIAKSLKSLGVEKVYTYPGGTIAPLLDALIQEGITYFCAKTEQGAGYGAIGAAKVSGKPQVLMVTSGPGATNALTPIADAYYDSIPILLITGQVGTNDINFEGNVRQTGFQETNSIGIYSNITKRSKILNRDKIVDEIQEMYNLTISQRPGPTHIDLPMDIQRTEFKPVKIKIKKNGKNKTITFDEEIELLQTLIKQSKKPLIISGNGIHISKSEQLLQQFIKKTGIPVVHTLPGIGSNSSNDKLSFSYIGYGGEYYSNLAVYNSDLLIIFGSRLDLRQTGNRLDIFKTKKIFRVDIDKNELKYSRIKTRNNVCGDLNDFLKELNKVEIEVDNLQVQSWVDKIKKLKQKYSSDTLYKKYPLSTCKIIKEVSKISKNKKVIVSSGVGIHQLLAARYFSFDNPNRIWLTSAGHGTMGYDLPTIIGAVQEKEDYTGIVFVGDGSFQMNIQELAIVKEKELPIKIFVLDNKRLGLVSQFQIQNWKDDPTTGKKQNPSFSKIGKAYGINSYQLKNQKNIKKVLKEVFSDNKPALIHVMIPEDEDLVPMLLGGQKLDEMYPFTKD